LSEASEFFEGKGAVQQALRKITTRLDELGISYSVAGAMALFHHGVRRFTEDVDILVTREGLKEIHQRLEGLGYLPLFAGSKNLRDTESGVKIEFLVTGDFPGDGQPKPVQFPEPADVTVKDQGIAYVNLSTLINLKIASGMTSSERLKDLADVQELIKTLNLPSEFAQNLNPFVRDKFQELWTSARPPEKRYLTLWRNKFLTTEAATLGEMVSMLEYAVSTLKAMQADGVTLEPARGSTDDYAYLVTTDPAVARKYDMHDESEFLGDEDDEEAISDT
jgi:hypothetical protein